MPNENEKEKILSLLFSGDKTNLNLGMQIANSLKFDLSDILLQIATLHDCDYGTTMTGFSSTDERMRLRRRLDPHYLLAYASATDFKFNYKFRYLCNEIGVLRNLETLTAMNSKQVQIPPSVCQLLHLQKIDYRQNKLKQLPEKLARLRNLKTLLLSHNHLDKLPEDIGELTHLQDLDLEGNLLRSLPDSFTKLQHLQTLNLRANPDMDWAQVFAMVSQMPNLKVLLWGTHEIINNPASLQTLNLSSQTLKRGRVFNHWFYNLDKKTMDKTPNWRSLDRCQNWTLLLDGVARMPNLRQLRLESNNFEQLDARLALATQLTHLYLSDNKLTHLPDFIGDMIALENIYLSNNPLKSLPQSLAKLRNLRLLSVSYHPELHFPEALLQNQNLVIRMRFPKETKIFRFPFEGIMLPPYKK